MVPCVGRRAISCLCQFKEWRGSSVQEAAQLDLLPMFAGCIFGDGPLPAQGAQASLIYILDINRFAGHLLGQGGSDEIVQRAV